MAAGWAQRGLFVFLVVATRTAGFTPHGPRTPRPVLPRNVRASQSLTPRIASTMLSIMASRFLGNQTATELDILRDQNRGLRLAISSLEEQLALARSDGEGAVRDVRELKLSFARFEEALAAATANATRLSTECARSDRLQRLSAAQVHEIRGLSRDALARVSELEAIVALKDRALDQLRGDHRAGARGHAPHARAHLPAAPEWIHGAGPSSEERAVRLHATRHMRQTPRVSAPPHAPQSDMPTTYFNNKLTAPRFTTPAQPLIPNVRLAPRRSPILETARRPPEQPQRYTSPPLAAQHAAKPAVVPQTTPRQDPPWPPRAHSAARDPQNP
mmetsp:Transcript_27409/g.94776  ORF Transcript_27409/g.94776 Transcript_27409/m.94776 type:complete len:331 (-) Transcript_27409:423-1415(-)